jgi:hypothetical protein
MVRMNARMAALGPPSIGGAGEMELVPRLAAILADGFLELGDCLVLAHEEGSVEAARIESYPDATKFEAFINHLHLDDELELPAGDPLVLKQAGRYAAELAELLQGEYPDEAFVILIALGDSCVVRFHKRRSGESWIADDLEGYEYEAVMVVDVPA